MQRDVYQAQRKRCQDQIHHLIINRQVPRRNNPGKDNIVIITEKNTTIEFYEYLYYITRITRRLITTERRWFKVQHPHSRLTAEQLMEISSMHLTGLKKKVM